MKSSGQQSAVSKSTQTSKDWNQINRGESAFKPKKASGDAELQARIDAVVAKADAEGTGRGGSAFSSADVIRYVRPKYGRFMGFRATKF